MISYEQLGKNLKSVREQRGLKQTQAAALINVTSQYLSAVERGVEKPSLKFLEELCGVLGIALQDAVSAVSDQVPTDPRDGLDQQLMEDIKCLCLRDKQLLEDFAQSMIKRS